ncbi:MAG: GvpL/GvpF family gas vesicle protein [Pseudomonadota bacterium]
MQTQTKSNGTRGRYLYGIIPGSGEKSYGRLGLNNGPVYTISHGEVSAIVSDVANQKIRPERRHLAAHQTVLKRVMEDFDLLPMSFGIISDGPGAVKRLLKRNRKAIADQLKRISGRIEMGLKVSWDVPNIFEYMVNIHRDLLESRDRLVGLGARASQDDRIAVGQMFEELLELDRQRYTEMVEQVLRPRCTEIKRTPCREERDVMKLACLVDRSSIDAFEAGVLEAAACFDDNFTFDYNGPWAPHNFVEMEVEV